MVLSTMSCKHAAERKKVNVKFNIYIYYTLNINVFLCPLYYVQFSTI